MSNVIQFPQRKEHLVLKLRTKEENIQDVLDVLSRYEEDLTRVMNDIHLLSEYIKELEDEDD